MTPAPVVTLRRAIAPFTQLTTLNFGNVAKNSTSSTQTVRFYNNMTGTAAVSDASDCELTIYTSDGSSTPNLGRGVGYGDQILDGNWVSIKNLCASDSDGHPLTTMIDEVIGVGDGADSTMDISKGSTSLGTQVPNNPSSEADTNPCIVVRKSIVDSGADNVQKLAASWTFQVNTSGKAPVVRVTALAWDGNDYICTNVTVYGDSFQLDGDAQTDPEPTTGENATATYYYNSTLEYTTDYTYANGASNGTITFVVAPSSNQEVEVDYLYRTPDAAFITIPDDEATTGSVETGHSIGGRVVTNDIPDNDQDQDESLVSFSPPTGGTSTFMDIIKDAYATKDGTTSYGYAETQLKVAVPSSCNEGQEAFILRLSYTYV